MREHFGVATSQEIASHVRSGGFNKAYTPAEDYYFLLRLRTIFPGGRHLSHFAFFPITNELMNLPW